MAFSIDRDQPKKFPYLIHDLLRERPYNMIPSRFDVIAMPEQAQRKFAKKRDKLIFIIKSHMPPPLIMRQAHRTAPQPLIITAP